MVQFGRSHKRECCRDRERKHKYSHRALAEELLGIKAFSRGALETDLSLSDICVLSHLFQLLRFLFSEPVDFNRRIVFSDDSSDSVVEIIETNVV